MWFLILIGIIALVIASFLLNFYKDPKRNIPKGNNIVSPADGRIINILKTSSNKIKINKGFLGKIEALTREVAKDCFVVSIFMSPLDVHVNRAPIDGVVESTRHEKGKFFAAYEIEKSLQNEKNEIIIKNRRIGRIKVIQIAGFLARRIICSVNKKEKVNKGQRIGKIVLGSQVTLIIPSKSTNLRIKKGQMVKAGSTIIADLT